MPDLLQTIASSSNPRNALNILLRLSVVAPDEGQAENALAVAQELAQQLPPDVVREVEHEIEQDGDGDADQCMRAAIQRLADGESDDIKRAEYHRIAEVFRPDDTAATATPSMRGR